MRTRALVFAVAAAMLTVPLAVAATPDTPSMKSKATLRVVDSTPLVLRGGGFRVHESVRVVVSLGKQSLTRQARTGIAGGFTVSFAGVTFDPCGTAPSITARGLSSGLVSAVVLPRDCAMPGTNGPEGPS